MWESVTFSPFILISLLLAMISNSYQLSMEKVWENNMYGTTSTSIPSTSYSILSTSSHIISSSSSTSSSPSSPSSATSTTVYSSTTEGLSGPASCCYGSEEFGHDVVVESLPQCCLQFRCEDGNITKQYFNNPGDHGCCEFDGHMYPEGTQLPGFCWKIICEANEWVFTGCIDDCCGHCYVHTDPHFVTFDDYKYDFHGTCNYSLTQTDRTDNPDVGVYSDFEPCFGAASCLDESTFKDNPNTVINLHSDTVYTLGVNGNSFVVPAEGVHQVAFPECGIYHSVLAFQYHGCVVLLGSSRIAVMKCPYRIDVWAHPSHMDGLDGLCGHFSSYKQDDLTDKIGHIHPLNSRPDVFPHTWITDFQADEQCLEPCDGSGVGKGCSANIQKLPADACTPDDPDFQAADVLCNQYLQGLADPYLMSTCCYDLCVMRRNGNLIERQISWLQILILNARVSERLTRATICASETTTPPTTTTPSTTTAPPTTTTTTTEIFM